MVVGRTFWDFLAEMIRAHGLAATLIALALLLGVLMGVLALISHASPGVKLNLGWLEVQLDSLAALCMLRKYLSI